MEGALLERLRAAKDWLDPDLFQATRIAGKLVILYEPTSVRRLQTLRDRICVTDLDGKFGQYEAVYHSAERRDWPRRSSADL